MQVQSIRVANIYLDDVAAAATTLSASDFRGRLSARAGPAAAARGCCGGR